MTNFMGTAIAAAFQAFEESLIHQPTIKTTSKAHTSETEGDPVSFLGVLVSAKRFERVFSEGGFNSQTKRLLLVYPTTKDADGNALEITVDDAIVDTDGVSLFVLSRIDESTRFGVIVYELGEERE